MDEQPFNSLNVIPLVDIMLVLLTIVLTTASFIATGRIPVSLPQASASQGDKHQDKTIEIAASGQILFDNAPVTIEEFEQRLAPLPRDTTFLVRADRTIPLQRFIDVADVLKRLKFEKIAIQTKTAARPVEPTMPAPPPQLVPAEQH
jgi:biopolymer transport protein ExbD